MFEVEFNFSFIINPYLATYDAQHSVDVGDRTPVLPVFTICHWLKLDSVPQGPIRKRFFQVWMAGIIAQVWSDIEVHNNQIELLMYIRPLVTEKPEIQR